MSFAKPMAGLAAPLLLLGIGAAVLGFDPFGAASGLRGRLFDAYARHIPPGMAGSVSSPVRLLTFDPTSLAGHGRWPWPEADIAALTRAANDAGARLLVFTTPLDAPSGGALVTALRSQPAVAPVLLGVGGLAPQPHTPFVYRGHRDPFGDVPTFALGAGPSPDIAAAARGIGASTLTADADGILRRMPVVFRLNGALIPSLAAETARLAAGEAQLTVTTDETDPLTLHWGRAGIAALETGGHAIPAQSDGSVWMDYRARPEEIAASALLAHELGPVLKNHILVLDTPDETLATPVGPMTRGAVIATGLADLMTGTVLQRPSFAPAAELWGLILGGGLLLLMMAQLRSWWSGLYVATLLAAGFYGSWFAYLRLHWLIDPATPGLALLLAFIAGALARLAEVRAARAHLRLAFAESLPRATVEKIAHRPELLTVEGQTRDITYLVCGVRGLAEMAAALRDDPRAFTQIMQQVLTPLMDQALAHGGTIDRLTGDGFAAFWNAPLDDADHALHACEAASGMSILASRVSEQIALTRASANTPALEIGIGVATGPAIAGGFGGAGRLGYSVHGDVVTLAARIQALSPHYGPAVIVAESTQADARRGFAFLEVDYIASGREDPPVRLYALLGNPVVRASPKFRALIAFHEHIFASLRRQQWGKARELIAQCRRLSGASQKLYDLHLTRIGYFESNPPGPEWDGAFRPILK